MKDLSIGGAFGGGGTLRNCVTTENSGAPVYVAGHRGMVGAALLYGPGLAPSIDLEAGLAGTMRRC